MVSEDAADERLTSYAAVLGWPIDACELRSGQRHDVVRVAAAGEAWRFPRTAAALAAVNVSAARYTAARELGLPAPSVLDVVDAPLGVARMGTQLIGGVGMSPSVVDALAPAGRARLVEDLAGLLARLRGAPSLPWPGTDESWPARWLSLAERIRTSVLPLIESPSGRRRAEADLNQAMAAAQDAGLLGLTHGDLGGENIHLDPQTGHILGVLDWDDAAPGDPALDLAAINAHAPPWLRAGLLAADRSLSELVVRAQAYLGTFALQEALWGVESGDAGSVASGLARYP
jgi:aminoglycoside 2''-phosphotransferase